MFHFLVRSFSSKSGYLFNFLCSSLTKASATSLLNERTNILNSIILESKEYGVETLKKTVELISGKVLFILYYDYRSQMKTRNMLIL